MDRKERSKRGWSMKKKEKKNCIHLMLQIEFSTELQDNECEVLQGAVQQATLYCDL